ncbi:SOS response-associated peptidase [Pelagibacterium xiamenense]|uniref:SOS response-associated peptidase n=1 Tax=Pelagibacterium xiamenense TaxID=2901140 RepID=UPI001E629C4C|nr:SOS response-associated peptidase [Pelagibacterium xiamenense]MCD7059309.1 SOS response-associated peptidase [Pelagibacterium xiamenense]
MCGRYAFTLPSEAMETLFGVRNVPEYPPRYNIAPTQPILSVMRDESGARAAKLARWGLVPAWVKDPREFPLIINARAESMAQKPAFRDSVKHHRCVVPASGYYEWHRAPDGTKIPHYIALASGEPLPMAGLYATWMGPNGEEIDSAAVITVPANPDLVHIHDRMPAILDRADLDAWLDVRGTDAGTALAAIRSAPQGTMTAHPVSSRVNSARNEGEDLIAPVAVEKPSPDSDKAEDVKPVKPSQLDLF